MPAFAVGTGEVPVGMDDHQFGMPRRVWRRRMGVQLSEAATEIEVLFLRDVLIAEEDHQVLRKRSMDLAKGLVAEGLGEIDAADLGADDRRQPVHGYRLVGTNSSELCL